MKYLHISITDNLITTIILHQEAVLFSKETPLTQRAILEPEEFWQESFALASSNAVDAIFISTDSDSYYTHSQIKVGNDCLHLQQFFQEHVLVPVVDRAPKDIENQVAQARDFNAWTLQYTDFLPGKKEKSREAMLTIGTGVFGLRGAFVESKASNSHYPGLYLAGGFNTLETPIGEHVVSNEDFVNFPNPQFFSFSVDGGALFVPTEKNIVEIMRTLDLATGYFTTKMIANYTEKQLVEIVSEKVANMDGGHELAIRYTVKPLNFSGNITIHSEIDADIINAGVDRYKSLSSQHLVPIEAAATALDGHLKVMTNTSKISMDETVFFSMSDNVKPVQHSVEKELILVHSFSGFACEEQTVQVTKNIFITSTLDPLGVSVTPCQHTFDEVLTASTKAWEPLWERANITLHQDIFSEFLLKLHTYHLLVSASQNNIGLDASIGARGLHGEAYRGHIFWDEIFVFPFYFQHFPDVARQLLMYRYNRLDSARAYAKAFGYEGAMFPWQSGGDGTEQSQTLHLNPVSGKWDPDHSALQRHVSLAIAYNVIMYVHHTEDDEFLKNYGAELLLEIAQFWKSIAILDEQTGRYDIEGVMGPDEFHEMYPGSKTGGIKNNAYTNIFVSMLFTSLIDLLTHLSEVEKKSLLANLGMSEDDLVAMQNIAHHLNLDINEDSIIAQYEGFLDLAEINFDAYREKYGDVYRMDRILRAEGKSADNYQVVKQADALMIFYLFAPEKITQILRDLGYELDGDYLEKNLHYYLERTSHGSTLSRVVHTMLAEMVDDESLALELYQSSLVSDYEDIQGGTTAEGIHTGVMAGTLDIASRTLAGVERFHDILHIAPNVPANWQGMQFNYFFKGIDYQFDITNDCVKVTSSQDTPLIIFGKKITLRANEQQTITKEVK